MPNTEIKLIEIEEISESNAPVVYVAGGLKHFFEKVRDEVKGEVPDLTTAKGRARIASLAAKVSKSKVAVEKPGREYLKRLKEMPKVVESELREFIIAMDSLRDEIRKPLTDWEEADVARRDALEDRVQAIKDCAFFDETPSSQQVAEAIAEIEVITLDDSWQEFLADAGQAKDQSLTKLRALLIERTNHEAAQAELEKLRKEREEREQKDRDEQIAREAADTARREAEEKANREREEQETRVRNERLAAEKRESDLRLQAEQAERQAEQDRLARIESERRAAQEKADNERRQKEMAEQAEADRIEAEQRAEQQKIDAEKRQQEAVEQARKDEQARQQAAEAEERRQAEAREADKQHRAKINSAALKAFIEGGMTEETAKLAVTLIVMRKIPAIKIEY